MNRRDSLSRLLALGIAAHSPEVLAQARTGVRKRVGFLCVVPPTEALLRKIPVLLAKEGWVEGSNISYEWRQAGGKREAMPGLAAEIVSLRTDVIVTDTNIAALATAGLTRTTPIAVLISLDPVHVGLAKSLARPGGNVTGQIWGEPRLAAKIVEFLHQAVPHVRRLAVIYDPGSSGIQAYIDADEAAANALGIECRRYALRATEDLPAVFDAVRKDRMEAIKAAISGLGIAPLRQLLAYASRHGMPTVSVNDFSVRMGALLAYYPDMSDSLFRLSAQLDKLLRGTPPSEIPFETPSKFNLAVNLQTAKALGIAIPERVLLTASSLVE